MTTCHHFSYWIMKGEGRMVARDPSSSAGMKKTVTRLGQTSRKHVLREHGASRRKQLLVMPKIQEKR